MKKFFWVLFVALAGVCSANAQSWYVGGSLNIRSYSEAESTYDNPMEKSTFGMYPEVGYNTAGKWSFGAALGYVSTSYDGDYDSESGFSFSPYARYRFYEAGNLAFFADGGLTFVSIGSGDNKMNQHIVGVQPGVSYSLNKTFSLVAHIGFVGFRGGDNKAMNGFELSVSNNLSFGFYYNF